MDGISLRARIRINDHHLSLFATEYNLIHDLTLFVKILSSDVHQVKRLHKISFPAGHVRPSNDKDKHLHRKVYRAGTEKAAGFTPLPFLCVMGSNTRFQYAAFNARIFLQNN
jgi:hypothetical protein